MEGIPTTIILAILTLKKGFVKYMYGIACFTRVKHQLACVSYTYGLSLKVRF